MAMFRFVLHPERGGGGWVFSECFCPSGLLSLVSGCYWWNFVFFIISSACVGIVPRYLGTCAGCNWFFFGFFVRVCSNSVPTDGSIVLGGWSVDLPV